MPYIKKEDREFIKQDQENPITSATRPSLIPSECTTAGDLNYAITELIKGYMESRKLNYQTINDIVGALEGAKLEFYRRIAIPYENKKIKENGDVY